MHHRNSDSDDRQYNRRHCKPPSTSANNHSSAFNCVEILRSKLFLSIIIVSAVIITLLCIGLVVLYDQTDDIEFSIDEWTQNLSEKQAIWYESGLNELKIALQRHENKKRARNVILFVGDGMGPNTVTATRIYKYGENGHLAWERFPHMGLLKVMNVYNKFVYGKSLNFIPQIRHIVPINKYLIQRLQQRHYLVVLRQIIIRLALMQMYRKPIVKHH